MIKNTADRILDTAERLFAKEGYHSASLRRITGEAGVNLGAVNYHFSSKQGLIVAVLARRVAPLNEIRMRMLDEVLRAARSAGQPPKCRDILRAFLEPALRLREASRDARHFLTLIGRIMYESDETLRVLFLQMMTPIFLSFRQALTLALPDLPDAVVFRRLLFVIGVMSHALCLGEKLGGNIQVQPVTGPQEDAARMFEHLLIFVQAGMEAPCPN